MSKKKSIQPEQFELPTIANQLNAPADTFPPEQTAASEAASAEPQIDKPMTAIKSTTPGELSETATEPVAESFVSESPVSISSPAKSDATNPVAENVALSASDPEAGTAVIVGEAEVVQPDAPNASDPEADRRDFERLDRIFRGWMKDFHSAGNALAEINRRDLWSVGGHASWAAYSTNVCGMSKTQANRLIAAAGVMENLKQLAPVGVTPFPLPRNESQVRPLFRLKDREKQASAWHLSIERAGTQPTSDIIQMVVAELMAEDGPSGDAKPNRKRLIADAYHHLEAAVSSGLAMEEVGNRLKKLGELLKLARSAA